MPLVLLLRLRISYLLTPPPPVRYPDIGFQQRSEILVKKENLKPKFRSPPHGLMKVGLPFPRRMKVLTYIDFDGHFGFDAKAVYIYGIDALWTIYAYAE